MFSGTAAVPPGTRSIGLLARQDLAARDAVRRVLEAPALYRLFEGLLQARRPLFWLQLELTREGVNDVGLSLNMWIAMMQEAAVTTAYKWLRAVGPNEFTGELLSRVSDCRAELRTCMCFQHLRSLRDIWMCAALRKPLHIVLHAVCTSRSVLH